MFEFPLQRCAFNRMVMTPKNSKNLYERLYLFIAVAPNHLTIGVFFKKFCNINLN